MLLFILFHHCVVFHCVSILKILYPFYSWWMLRMSLGFCYYKQCYHKHSWTFLWGAYIHISIEYIPNSGIPWSWCVLSNLGDSFLKFAADYLNYPQQCLRVQDAAHLHQHLVLSVVLIFRVFFGGCSVSYYGF